MTEHKISVYMQDSNELVSFLESHKIVVFELHDKWEKKAELIWGNLTNSDPVMIRRYIKDMIKWLNDCKILAGLNLSGFAYNEFNRSGLHIFDITEYNPQVFDDILADIKEAESHTKHCAISAYPVPGSVPGVYHLDLIAVQTQHPELSSKSILNGFFQSEPFTELRLICTHIPPWIENGAFEIKQRETSDHKILALISKK